MSTEVECFRVGRVRTFSANKDLVIPPGNIEGIDFLSPIVQLLVSCGIDNLTASIMFQQGCDEEISRNIILTLFRDEDDEEGEEVEVACGNLFTIRKHEEVLIESFKRRGSSGLTREIWVSLSSSDDSFKDNSPIEERPFVLV